MNNCENGKCPVNEIIAGIKCDVVNCAYHTEGNKCHAGHIEVGNGCCSSSKDTNCNTFRPKSDLA